MKKLTLFLLAMLLIAATSVFAEGGSEAAAAGKPRLELTKAYYFGEPTDNREYKQEWMDYMSDRFGIDLDVNPFPRPEYMTKYALAMSSGEIHGLGWIFGGAYMEDYYSDGATMDIKPYVEDNAVWQSLPEGMRENNVRNGDLLALPSGWSGGLAFLRSIRKDWLDTLGMDMPETVEEFYEAIKAFTEEDPDGNGKDDTIGMTSAGIWNMGDLFMSFGVPVNHVVEHLITPDPHDNFRFNDGMLKPQIVDLLEWLKRAYDNGYLDQEVFANGGTQMRDRMSSGKYGSAWYWANWVRSFETRIQNVVPDADIEGILGLTSDFADKYVNTGGGKGSGAPWVLIAGTDNPDEQVDNFVNIFFGDEIGYWSGRYGVYEKYWEFGPNKELVRLPRGTNDEGKTQYYPGPGIVSDLDPKFNHVEYPRILEGRPEADNEAYNAWLQKKSDMLEEGLEKEIFYTHPNEWKEPDSETYRNIGADIGRIFEETVAKAVTGQVPIDEAVADYRRQVGKLGGQKVLDEANAAIGKTSSTEYTYE